MQRNLQEIIRNIKINYSKSDIEVKKEVGKIMVEGRKNNGNSIS